MGNSGRTQQTRRSGNKVPRLLLVQIWPIHLNLVHVSLNQSKFYRNCHTHLHNQQRVYGAIGRLSSRGSCKFSALQTQRIDESSCKSATILNSVPNCYTMLQTIINQKRSTRRVYFCEGHSGSTTGVRRTRLAPT